ncbi:NYN domain-containing protein [bacterium]|nr:MAG: NYN domain-containing protein [bacterium]
MATLWIIDGYNFIRQSRRFAELEARNGARGKEAALRWLGVGRRTGERVCVVFDAYSRLENEMKEDRLHGVRVLASRGGYTADEEIIAMAREKGAAAVVVSSDRAIQEAAVKAGASILKSDEFEREVAKILEGEAPDEEALRARRRPGKGDAFRPPKEKKKALALLKKYQ